MDDENNYNYCWKCGEKCTNKAKFCSECGNKLNNEDDNLEGYLGDFDKIDIIKFMQKNVDYYVPRFTKIQNEKGITWNWAAFFFNGYWLLYRKMYNIGLAIILFKFIFDSIAIGMMIINRVLPEFIIIINFILIIFCGFYGNIAYLKFIKDKIDSFKFMNAGMKENMLRDKGGINLEIPIIVGVIVMLLISLEIGIIGNYN